MTTNNSIILNTHNTTIVAKETELSFIFSGEAIIFFIFFEKIRIKIFGKFFVCTPVLRLVKFCKIENLFSFFPAEK